MRTIVAVLALALGACAFGYSSDDRVLGVAAGQAGLTNCTAAEPAKDCQTIQGGSLSDQAVDLFSGITGALRGLVFGTPD